jgi:hypothetical protein
MSGLEKAVEHKKPRNIMRGSDNVNKISIPFSSKNIETVPTSPMKDDSPQIDSGNNESSSTSILHQLRTRSTSCMNRNISILKTPRWTPCPWLHLQCPSTITVLEFDQEGVLLAAAATGSCHSIYLWDWDTVVASDLQGRIDGRKDILPPILALNVPHPVTRLEWDQDSLAVSFRANSHIHVYDMFAICNSSVPPERACTVLRAPIQNVSRNQSSLSISFLPDQHFIAGFSCGTVCVWRLSLTPTISWLWKCSEPVNCILPIAKNLILLGGAQGTFVILDWTKMTRKAFASEKSPTVVSLWKPQTRMQVRFPTVPLRDWGIQTMHLDNPCRKNMTQVEMKDDSCFGRCRVVWVTSGGWCLSLDLHRRHGDPQILSSPPEVQQMTFEGNIVPKPSVPKFSSSSYSIVSTSDRMGSMVWQSVPRITHILPPHDRRIGLEHQISVDTDIEFEYWNHMSSSIQRVSALSQRPKAIALHRNQEWMVAVVSSARLGIWNARCPPVRRKCQGNAIATQD